MPPQREQTVPVSLIEGLPLASVCSSLDGSRMCVVSGSCLSSAMAVLSLLSCGDCCRRSVVAGAVLAVHPVVLEATPVGAGGAHQAEAVGRSEEHTSELQSRPH